MMFELIAFDADDTLWHNERLYKKAEDQLVRLLGGYADETMVTSTLYEKEMENLPSYGYGIKSYTLSMVETAIALSGGEILAADVWKIIELGRGMMVADVCLLDHVHTTIEGLARAHDLMIITKGDLRDQERKLRNSSLSSYFREVEIVSDKCEDVYLHLLAKYRVQPQSFLMVGNSLKSDILPVLRIGSSAVYIPYHITWQHERVELEDISRFKGYHEIEHIGLLPELLRTLEAHG
jgi:putative hydrolase of the HAD superfamily